MTLETDDLLKYFLWNNAIRELQNVIVQNFGKQLNQIKSQQYQKQRNSSWKYRSDLEKWRENIKKKKCNEEKKKRIRKFHIWFELRKRFQDKKFSISALLKLLAQIDINTLYYCHKSWNKQFPDCIRIIILYYQRKIDRLMQNCSDSSFIPNSEDQNNKLRDPKWLSKKRKAKLKIKQISSKRSGTWDHFQNQTYINFLSVNLQCFQDEHLRRSKKVFNQLSSLLPNRTAEQCRSHHQKLQFRCKSENPQDMIDYLRRRMMKKKKYISKKTTNSEEQWCKIKDDGYVFLDGASKQIKILINWQSLPCW